MRSHPQNRNLIASIIGMAMVGLHAGEMPWPRKQELTDPDGWRPEKVTDVLSEYDIARIIKAQAKRDRRCKRKI